MGNTSHMEEQKKELVKEVHQLTRLGVRLAKAPTGGCFGSLMFLIIIFLDVKENQHLNLVLMELKDLLLSKLNE